MSNIDISILVNGNRCKQYNHNGRIFVEAKDGSEYSIEIKNNGWKRVLACISVDGLNILDGKTATSDGPGYVVNGYSSGRFDGFRVSDTQVAKFVFGKKGESYAADKGDGAERNVGVIGFRVYEELVKPQPLYLHSQTTTWTSNPVYGTATPLPPQPTIWCDNTADTMRCCADDAHLDFFGMECERGPVKYGCNNIPTATPEQTEKVLRSLTHGICSIGDEHPKSTYTSQIKPQGFDMGTKWGQAKESRVIEVEFERGLLSTSLDIYYASRQSLIEMGVPIGNEKQVNFPSSFADSKYAKPPKNWQG